MVVRVVLEGNPPLASVAVGMNVVIVEEEIAGEPVLVASGGNVEVVEGERIGVVLVDVDSELDADED